MLAPTRRCLGYSKVYQGARKSKLLSWMSWNQNRNINPNLGELFRYRFEVGGSKITPGLITHLLQLC